jgi:peptide/nickel transport system permease protein/oligopeptide transport system permease protein
MQRYLFRRTLVTIPTVLLASMAVFLMIRLIPGDPVQLIAGDDATPEIVESIREQWGLNQPLFMQYLIFMGNMLRGDLGISIRTRYPVSYEISLRFPETAYLALTATTISVAAGVLIGIIAGARPYSLTDNASMLAGLLGLSAPVFWIGLMLIWVFSVKLRWFPAIGSGSWAHLVLPSITLAAFGIPAIARQMRSSVLEEMGQDYIRTARSKGLSERAIVYKHAVRNALVPVITVTGVSFGRMLGGSIITETVFAYPGMGKLLIEGITARDYPIVQGVILVYTLLFMCLNVIIDMTYALVDPRIQYG